MTRRPGKKVARKAIRKTRAERSSAARKSSPDKLDAFIDAGVRALDLKIDKSWLPAIGTHLKVTLAHGARVAAFALPDDTEPAPVFKA